MSVTQLQLYNGALRLLGERILGSLSENREPRRALDDAWNNNAVQYCLESGLWTFAIRSESYEYSPSVEPSFGYQYAFNKPDDYIRTAAVCSDPYFNNPLTQYADEAGFWFSDLQTIYIKFTSNDPAYGNNYALWTQRFTNFVQAYLAQQIAPRITKSKQKKDDIDKEVKRSLIEARSVDAMNEPAKFMPAGSWSRSRHGRQYSPRRTNNNSW